MWKPFEVDSADIGAGSERSGLEDYLSRVDIAALLIEKKAIVFRNFGISPSGFGGIASFVLPNRIPYLHGNSPRTKLADLVYTSTEYPNEMVISMHNELSYSAKWPSRLLFYCERASRSGGETPVVDGSVWLDALDPEVRKEFARGLKYTQNLHDGYGPGKSWQDTFETDSKAKVDDFLSNSAASWEWRNDGGLRISTVRPATIRHPVTAAEVWFAQPDQWHIGALRHDSPETAEALTSIYSDDDLPQSVTYSDGEAIPDEHVMHIRECGFANAINVQWKAGDLMLIDNVLVAHGRRPFVGDRRVLVAMSE
jgi:alpha-ketoglutarate-dependent taurine dioxygenase